MATINANMNASVDWIPLTEAAALALVPGFYTLDSENLEVGGVHLDNGYSWGTPNGRWVARGVAGSVKASHTSGAPLVRYYPDAPGGGGPGVTPTLAEVLAQGNDTNATTILSTTTGADPANVGRAATSDAANADATSTALVGSNGNASADAGATVTGDGNASASIVGTVGGNGNVDVHASGVVTVDGNVNIGPSAFVNGSGDVQANSVFSVAVDGTIYHSNQDTITGNGAVLADAILAVGGNGNIEAGIAATLTGDGNVTIAHNAFVVGTGDAFTDSYATAADGSASVIRYATGGGAGNADAGSSATASGPGVNAVQSVTGGGTISGGTWVLELGVVPGLPTVPWNATAGDLDTLISDADIIVSGGPIASAPFIFTFTGAYGYQSIAAIAVDPALLTGIAPTLTVDFAVVVGAGPGTATAVASATAAGGSASIGPIATATTAEIQVNGLPLYTEGGDPPPEYGIFVSLFYVDNSPGTGGTYLWDFVTAAYVKIALALT